MLKRLESLEELVDFLTSSTISEIDEVGFDPGFKDGLFCISYKDISVAFDFNDKYIEHLYVSLQGNQKVQNIDINGDVDDDVSRIIIDKFNKIIVPIGERCLEGV